MSETHISQAETSNLEILLQQLLKETRNNSQKFQTLIEMMAEFPDEWTSENDAPGNKTDGEPDSHGHAEEFSKDNEESTPCGEPVFDEGELKEELQEISELFTAQMATALALGLAGYLVYRVIR